MCLFPWGARRCPDGGRPIPDREGELKLPCGKCHECLSLRSFEWATRARHEISLHKDNCFITLSYDDDNLPSGIVTKKPFQDFLKRLRQKTGKKILYMVSHEYGGRTKRPHHHAIIFGWSPKKWNFHHTSPSGHPLFISEELSELWKHGFHSIGEANERTAYYIASYALKGKNHQITTQQGEIIDVTDKFDCSKRPGIGYEYLKLHFRELVHSGQPLPRAYKKKLKDFGDKSHNHFISSEYENALQTYEDRSNISVRGSQERLAKITISNANLNLQDNSFRESSDQQKFLKLQRYLKDEVAHYKEKNL